MSYMRGDWYIFEAFSGLQIHFAGDESPYLIPFEILDHIVHDRLVRLVATQGASDTFMEEVKRLTKQN
jgi:hypothetical protein